jgi:hypothetical protein
VPLKHSAIVFNFKLSFMAKQTGTISVQGTIDNMTYYQSKNGNLVRKKGGVSAERLKTDPAFKRVRETQSEFTRAAKASLLLRTAISGPLKENTDHLMVSRLSKTMMRVITTDPVNGRGLRTVTNGDITMLRNFEFNTGSALGTTLKAEFSWTINRPAGELSVNLAGFIPEKFMYSPPEATHFVVTIAGVELDLAQERYVSNVVDSPDIPITDLKTQDINLVARVTPNSNHLLFLVVGIKFYQKILNGTMYPLNNKGYNSLKIVEVNKA